MVIVEGCCCARPSPLNVDVQFLERDLPIDRAEVGGRGRYVGLHADAPAQLSRSARNRRRIEAGDRGPEHGRAAHARDFDRKFRKDFERNPTGGLQRCRAPVGRELLDIRFAVLDARTQDDVRKTRLEKWRQDQPVVDREGQVGLDPLQRAAQRSGQRDGAITRDVRLRRQIMRNGHQISTEVNVDLAGSRFVCERQFARDRQRRITGRDFDLLNRKSFVRIQNGRGTRHREGATVPCCLRVTRVRR